MPDLHKALSEPLQVDGQLIEEWKSLAERYPYFSAAHILLAKSAHEAGDMDYEQYLQAAAVRTVNRKALYNLILGPGLRKRIDEVEKLVAGREKEEVVSGLEDEERVFSGIEEEEVVKGLEEEEIISGLGEEQEEEQEEVIVEQEVQEKTEAPKVTTDPELAELEKEILYEAVYSTIEKEVQEIEEEGHSGLEEEKEKEEEEGKKEISEAGAVNPYTAWLLSRAKSMHYEVEPVHTPAEKKETAGEGSEQPKSQKDIIDAFIKKDPKISPAKKDVYSYENLGKMSLVEDDEFVTETLAKVYARQGKLDKAIKAYELLSLKYPEKSIYFANQLKKLKDKS